MDAREDLPSGQRAVAIDVLKGVGILLIAFWHSPLKQYAPTLHAVQSTFSVPLFFFISGVLFTPRGSVAEDLGIKIRSLLKPYAAVLLIVAVLALWRDNWGSPATVIEGAAWGTGQTLPLGFAPLWFLPALFAAVAVTVPLMRGFEAWAVPLPLRWVSTVLLLLLGAHLLTGGISSPAQAWTGWPEAMRSRGWPWSLDLVPVTAGWMVAGHLSSERVRRLRASWGWLCLFGTALGATIFLARPHVDLNMRVIDPPLAATIACALGIASAAQASGLLARHAAAARPLAYLGSMSLYILCFHMWIGSAVGYYLSKYVGSDGLPNTVAAYLFSVAVPVALGEVIARSHWLRGAFTTASRSDERGGAPGRPRGKA